MPETRVLSLGQEVPLEKEMVTHSSILAWKIPWAEEPGRLQSMRSQRVGHAISFANFSYFLINCINQDNIGFVVLTIDSDNAVAKTSHSCFLFSQN